MASCLGCYFFVESRIVTEAFHVPPSQLHISIHRYHSQSGLLTLHSWWEHKSWASTHFLVTAQTTNMVSCYNRTKDPDKTLGAAWTADINKASGDSAGHSHQYVPRLQHDPQTPAWPQAAAQTMDIHMALSGNMGHGHQHRL